MSYKKTRVIVRPWQPRNLPFVVTQVQLKEFIQSHVTDFAAVVYLGWVRRRFQGKTETKFIVATGKDRLEAKQRFKESQDFENSVWDLSPTSTQSDRLE